MLIGNRDAFLARMKAIGQAHDPTTLALAHLQNNGGLSGRMFARRLDDEEIGCPCA